MNKNIILLIGSLLIASIAAEAVVRLVWEENDYGYPKELFKADDTLGYTYVPYTNTSFKGTQYSSVPIIINSEGWRDREHQRTKKDQKTKRILVLGDSLAMGAGVSNDYTFCTLIDRTKGYECINTATNGYEIGQEIDSYLTKGYQYEPDIILIAATLNDARMINISAIEKSYLQERRLRSKISEYCKQCKLYYRTAQLLNRKETTSEYFDRINNQWDGGGWDYYKERIKGLENKKGKNTKIVIVIFPYTEQLENPLMKRTAQERIKTLENENIHVIDASEWLQEDITRYYLNGDHVHLSISGHQRTKEELIKRIPW